MIYPIMKPIKANTSMLSKIIYHSVNTKIIVKPLKPMGPISVPILYLKFKYNTICTSKQ